MRCGAEGFAIAPDALEDAAARRSSDRGVTRRELEKLMLYVQGRKQITLEDVHAVMGDEAEARADAVADAAGGGDLAAWTASWSGCGCPTPIPRW